MKWNENDEEESRTMTTIAIVMDEWVWESEIVKITIYNEMHGKGFFPGEWLTMLINSWAKK